MSTSQTVSPVPPAFDPGITHPLYLIRNGLISAFRDLAPELRGKLMDFGCGLKPYRSLFQVDEYIGVEYHGEGDTYDNAAADVFYDGHTLPFPDAHFDSIFSAEVFEHVFNLPEILVELNRVLKPGGKILISCPFAFGEHEEPADYARYTSFAVRHMFESNGFKLVRQVKTGSFYEALVQLRLVYFDKYPMQKIRRIPVMRSVVRVLVYGFSNLWARFIRNVYPGRQELYLNNVVLAEKI